MDTMEEKINKRLEQLNKRKDGYVYYFDYNDNKIRRKKKNKEEKTLKQNR